MIWYYAQYIGRYINSKCQYSNKSSICVIFPVLMNTKIKNRFHTALYLLGILIQINLVTIDSIVHKLIL